MNQTPDPSRRAFIKTVVAGGLIGAGSGPKSMASFLSESGAGAEDWVAMVRRQIPATHRSSYFQTGAFGPSPQTVIDRIKELLETQNLGPADPRQLAILSEAEDSCRTLLASTLGADPGEIALTPNTTTGMNIVLWSIDWQPGDEIIISDQEHPALLLPVFNLHRRFGVNYKKVPIGTHEDVVSNVLSQLSPRTRLVAMSHVSRGSGQLVPVRALAEILRARDIPLLLDGAQGPGNVRVDFHAIGCDYYSLCGHKWLLGPKGTGALLIRRDRIDSTPVSWTGSRAQSSMDETGEFAWQPDARRFEFATRNQADFGGWAEALRWLEALGWDRIHNRITALSTHASEAVRESGRFTLVSPDNPSEQNGIVVLRLPPEYTGLDFYNRLRVEHEMLVSPVSHPRDLRICLHFFNTETEFDALLDQLKAWCT